MSVTATPTVGPDTSSSASGMSFANTIQIIAPAASQPEPDGQERIEHEHEQEGRQGHDWLRQAREDAPPRRRPDRRAARHEPEADGEALRNVVHRNRGGNEEAELLPAPEGAPHAHPSANEWAVITPRMSNAFRASPPARSATSCAPCRLIIVLAGTMSPSSTSTPRSTRASLIADPSTMRLWLAASCVEPPGDTRTAYTSPNASHCRARVPQNNDDGHHRAPGIIPPSVTNIL